MNKVTDTLAALYSWTFWVFLKWAPCIGPCNPQLLNVSLVKMPVHTLNAKQRDDLLLPSVYYCITTLSKGGFSNSFCYSIEGYIASTSTTEYVNKVVDGILKNSITITSDTVLIKLHEFYILQPGLLYDDMQTNTLLIQLPVFCKFSDIMKKLIKKWRFNSKHFIFLSRKWQYFNTTHIRQPFLFWLFG